MSSQESSQESQQPIVFEVEEVTIEFSQEEPLSPETNPIPDEVEEPLSSESNPTISDAVSQTDMMVVGEAPATAETGFSQSLSLATSLTVQNAVNVQKQLTITHQANTNRELKHFLFPKLRRRSNKAYVESLKTLTGIMTRFESMQK